MLDVQNKAGDLPFDASGEFEDGGHFAERDCRDAIARPFEGRENVSAGRPRLFSIGFAVIRI